MTEATMLQEHGTVLARLKPINIIQAAAADIKLRDRKRAHDPFVADSEMYSFAKIHVARARSVTHLVSLAYFGTEKAANSTKLSTMIVYGDADLLRETLIDLLLQEHAARNDEPGA